jgi:hypothetical protein
MPAPSRIGGSGTSSYMPGRQDSLNRCEEVLGHPSRQCAQAAEKLTSIVGATLPFRAGAAAQLQYALV